MKSAYGTLNETNWQPWLGSTITGTRFSGSNSLTLGNQYYGCTLDATYTARNTSGQSVSSSVHVVFANSAATSPTGYTCNGVQQATPCQATNNQATNVQCLAENFIWADDFYNTTVNSSGQAVHLNCTAPIVSSGAIGTKYNLTALNGGQANGSSWQNGFGGVTAECAMINGVPKWKVSSSGTKTCAATSNGVVASTTPAGNTACTALNTRVYGSPCSICPSGELVARDGSCTSPRLTFYNESSNGSSYTLKWGLVRKGAISTCSASGGWTGTKDTSSFATVPIPADHDIVYTLTCGSETQSVTLEPSCPTNKVHNTTTGTCVSPAQACTIDGQTSVSGVCQCPTGQSVVNGACAATQATQTTAPTASNFTVTTASGNTNPAPGENLTFRWNSTGANGCQVAAYQGNMSYFSIAATSPFVRPAESSGTVTYRLICSNMVGSSPALTIPVTVSNGQSSAAASCSVSLNTNSISSDQAFTANVTSSGYSSVEYTFNGVTSTFKTLSGSPLLTGSQTFDPINTPGSYSAVVKGVKSDGTRVACSNSPVNFTVTQASVAAAQPTVTLTQTGTGTTAPNESFTVNWSSTNAVSCSFQVAVNGGVFSEYATGLTGSQQFAPGTPESYVGKVVCTGGAGTTPVEKVITHTIAAPVVTAANSCSVSVNKKSIYTDEPLTVSVASNGYTGMQYSLNFNAYQTWSYAVNSNEVFPAGTFTPGTYKYYFRGTPVVGNTSCGSGEANGAVTITVQARPSSTQNTINQNPGTDGGGPDGDSGPGTNADGSVGTGNQG
jgi:hypothetical protein